MSDITNNFNTDPYYDDFSESKGFLRMLFRPGYAVQARELTQLQTILQNQISRFADHTFENGSMVMGGEVSENYVNYARVTGVSGVNYITDLIGLDIRDGISGHSTAKIIHAENGFTAGSGDSNAVIFFNYVSGGTGFSVGTVLGATAADNSSINLTITGDYQIGGITADATNKALVVGVQSGIRYVDGYFVVNAAQQIGAYSLTGTSAANTLLRLYNNPTVSVGFSTVKEIITADQDESINDPAFGYYNYAAPGSDRYKIGLNITQKNYNPTATDAEDGFSRDTYLEFIRVKDGLTIKKELYPEYAVLEKTLARRTYDESGNYTVRPFEIHLNTAGIGLTQISADMSSGKAYISGHEFETQSTTKVIMDRARDTRFQSGKPLMGSVGPFVLGSLGAGASASNALTGFDLSTMPEVYLSAGSGVGATFSSMGTARFRGLQYTNSVNGLTAYNLHLFDISMTGGLTFGGVNTVFLRNNPGQTGSQFVNLSKTNGATVLQNNNESLLFPFPVGSSIKSIGNNGTTSIGNISYGTVLIFPNVLFSGGGTAVVDIKTLTGYPATENDQVQIRFPSGYNASTGYPSQDVIVLGASGQSLTGTISMTGSGVSDYSQAYITTSPAYISKRATVHVAVDLGKSYNTDYLRRTKTYTTETFTLTGGASYLWQEFRFDKGAAPYKFLSTVQGTPTVDVISIVSITGYVNNVGNQNIKSYFNLDGGQRDNYYDWSRLVLAPGYTAGTAASLSGPMNITLTRFAHSGVGPFTVDSYGLTTGFAYENIPVFTSPKSGTKTNLSDVLDFRPIRVGTIPGATGTGVTGNFSQYFLPFTTGVNDNQFDYIHYLPRTDKIALSPDRKFKVIKGISELNAPLPTDDPNAMTLYSVTLNPYTKSASDASIRYYNNRRYTMQDIGNLERRLDSVEYYSTLSLLEQEAKNSQVYGSDSTSTPAFKYGILVDPFRGHNIGDVEDPMYNCSVDYEKTELRPAFVNRVYAVGVTANSGTTSSSDKITTLNYSTTPVISQNTAGSTITVNPANIVNYLGVMKITPSSDFWFDDTTPPVVRVNSGGENDNWLKSTRSLTGQGLGGGFGTQWNDWESLWTGKSTTNETNTSNQTDTRSVSTVGTGIQTGQRNGTPESITDNIGNLVVKKDVIPYAKNTTISFAVTGLKPNTQMYVFLDGLNVTDRLVAGSLTSSASGTLNGSIHLNTTDTPTVIVGRKLLRVTDNSTNTLSGTTTAADGVFYVEGTYGINESGILSTRKPDIRRQSVKSDQFITNIFNQENETDGTVSLDGLVDPLSQTFMVDPIQYPSGIMVKTVNIYFSAKGLFDTDSVTLMLKPTVNGYPHPSKVMPFGTTTVYNNAITTSTTATTPTAFTFSSPVLLLPGETYAFSLLTTGSSFGVHASPVGYTKPAYIMASFAASSGGHVITKNINQDIKFNVVACVFGSSGTVTLSNTQSSEYGTSVNMHEYRLNIPDMLPTGTNITYTEKLLAGPAGSVSYSSVSNNKNTVAEAVKTYTPASANVLDAQATLSTTNQYVSPVIDTDRASVFLTENLVTSYVSAGEDTPDNVTAVNKAGSRYITKTISLQPGLIAKNLRVILTLSNPYPSSVSVWMRCLPNGTDENFYDKSYTQLYADTTGNVVSNTASDEYQEITYKLGATPTTGDIVGGFEKFSVKVVFASTNGTVIPKIRDMRVIAI